MNISPFEEYTNRAKQDVKKRAETMLAQIEARECAVKGEWNALQRIATTHPEIMQEIFRSYYDWIPPKQRRDFALACFRAGGEAVPGCRRAVRKLARIGQYEMPDAMANAETITIYRAGTEQPKKSPYSLKWTVKIGDARKEMKSSAEHCFLFEGEISPAAVIAYDPITGEILQSRNVKRITVRGENGKH